MMHAKPRTPKRLTQIAHHFDKPKFVIFIVFDALVKQKRYDPQVTINEDGVRVTVYSAGYANGIIPTRSAGLHNNRTIK